MKIGHRTLGSDYPPYVIAEIGSNHDGDLSRARSLIESCADAGVDAVKFQLFSGPGLVNPKLRSDFFQIIDRLTLPRAWLPELVACARATHVDFLATPFDLEAVKLLQEVDTPALKIASSDLTNHGLLAAAAQSGLPVLLSTGLAYVGEIERAVRFLRESGATELAVLHCIAEYPTPEGAVNLRILPLLHELLDVPVGFSDHTLGLGAAVTAVGLGACVLEKHVTYSKSASGPDHSFAIEMPELRRLVQLVKEAGQARGSARRVLTEEELTDRARARRGLFLRKSVPRGTVLTEDVLVALRPAQGIGAEHWSDVIGQRTLIDVEAHQPLTWAMLTRE